MLTFFDCLLSEAGNSKDRTAELLKAKRELSIKVLKILDGDLKKNRFMGGQCYTIAEVFFLTYVHLTQDALSPLSEFKHVVR